MKRIAFALAYLCLALCAPAIANAATVVQPPAAIASAVLGLPFDAAKATVDAAGRTGITIPAGAYGCPYIHDVHDLSFKVDPAAKFDCLTLYNVQNSGWSGGYFELPTAKATDTGIKIVRIAVASNVSFTDATILGAIVTLGGPEDSPVTGNHLINGRPAGDGISVEMKSTGVTLARNDVSRVFKAIVHSNTDHLTITDNNLHDFRTTGIDGGSTNLTITRNRIACTHPWAVGGNGDHADLIHTFNDYKATAPSLNLTIGDNILDQAGCDPVPIGILIEGDPTTGFDGMVIDHNWLFNSSAQGIAAFNIHNSSITNNLLYQTGGNANDAPSIRLVGSTEKALLPATVTVTGNTAHDVYGLLAYAKTNAAMANTILPPGLTPPDVLAVTRTAAAQALGIAAPAPPPVVDPRDTQIASLTAQLAAAASASADQIKALTAAQAALQAQVAADAVSLKAANDNLAAANANVSALIAKISAVQAALQ